MNIYSGRLKLATALPFGAVSISWLASTAFFSFSSLPSPQVPISSARYTGGVVTLPEADVSKVTVIPRSVTLSPETVQVTLGFWFCSKRAIDGRYLGIYAGIGTLLESKTSVFPDTAWISNCCNSWVNTSSPFPSGIRYPSESGLVRTATGWSMNFTAIR